MDSTLRCQSCGMPLGDGFFGTEKDGGQTQTYCKFCYQEGAFVQPDIPMEVMIQMSVDNMISELNLPEEKAHRLANEMIPKLKRWKKS